MPHRFSRTAMLIGREGLEKLKNSKVAVFGLGGVGSYVVEGLARAGVGEFHLVDFDSVDITNINRQIHATSHTVGRYKVELMAERVAEINPMARVFPHRKRYGPGADELIPAGLDYLVDAVDDVTAKVDLIIQSITRKIPVISSMGAGNKLRPEQLQIADISKTSVCPLARVVRRKLRDRGINRGVKVVFSTELPIKPSLQNREQGEGGFTGPSRKITPGSISFVPSVAGLFIAGEVVRDLLATAKDNAP